MLFLDNAVGCITPKAWRGINESFKPVLCAEEPGVQKLDELMSDDAQKDTFKAHLAPSVSLENALRLHYRSGEQLYSAGREQAQAAAKANAAAASALRNG